MIEECWNCSEAQSEPGAFCASCGAPQEEFEVTPSDGFLTNRSDIYLKNILDGQISRRDDTLDDGLVESLEAQLEHDVQKALSQLAEVMIADESIPRDAARSEMGDVDLTADWETLAKQLGAPGIGYLLLNRHVLEVTGNLEDRDGGLGEEQS
jgi:hypothetical protein